MINIPGKCRFVFEKLNKNGYECFAVGGCVRDALMGRKPNDWDFTTNALPDEITECFKEYKTIEVGKDYGTIAVISEGETYEITTYRCDGEYTDSRHPDSVTFTKSITDDLKRRDFTINSMAYSPIEGLVDPFNGQSDLAKKLIRCTGNPDERFNEDALRILRALRFSSVLNFEIEAETSDAVFRCMNKLSFVHPNRLRKEFMGIIMGSSCADILLTYKDVVSVFIPEIKPMFDLAQNNPHHKYDVWRHTVAAMDNSVADEIVKLAVFFHDIGKPDAKTTDDKGIDHFKKHQAISAEITRNVLTRLCFPNSVISDVCLLIKYHDERFRKFSYDIKRVLAAMGPELFQKLSLISFADIMGQSDYFREEKLSNRDKMLDESRRIIESNECYSLSQLAVSGDDIISLGYSGKDVGIILNTLLKMVMKGDAENTKEDLIARINNISLN